MRAISGPIRRRDQIIHGLDHSDQLCWLEERNVTTVRGHGVLDGERRVRVGGDVLVAERTVVIAVGTVAAMPPIPGLDRSARGRTARPPPPLYSATPDPRRRRGRRRARPGPGATSTAVPLLTHMGKYQARIPAENILGGHARVDRPAQGPLAPRIVFTEPQVAAVAHTLESALRSGIAAVAVDHATGGSARSSFYGRKVPGTARLVFDAYRDVLVGATFVGPDVAEMLHAATIAVVGEVRAARLVHAILAFPTRSEIWLRLLGKYQQAGRPRQLRAVG
jgi:pyruvate/2-oxoglutarate dehydrogenase complex dihydrolipoamide dehydrogenase (E3) component